MVRWESRTDLVPEQGPGGAAAIGAGGDARGGGDAAPRPGGAHRAAVPDALAPAAERRCAVSLLFSLASCAFRTLLPVRAKCFLVMFFVQRSSVSPHE